MSKGKETQNENKSYEDGVIKSRILLHLADKGVQERSDISDYLNENYGLKSLTNIKEHLYDLVDVNLLEKLPRKPGSGQMYNLKSGFDSFRYLFNFLKNNGYIIEFMRTKYYKEFIDSDEFRQKLLLRILKQSMRTFYNAIMDNDGYRKILSEIEKRDTEKYANLGIVKTILNEIKSCEPKDSLSIAILDLVDVTSMDSIDDIYDKISDRFDIKDKTLKPIVETLAEKEIPKKTVSQYTFKVMLELVMPEYEWQNIINICKMSPDTIDFVLNHSFYDFNILADFSIYLSGFYDNDDDIRSKNTYRFVKDKKIVNIFKILSKPIENLDTSQILNYPITTIAKSLLISDIAYNRINEDYSTEDLKKALYAQNEEEKIRFEETIKFRQLNQMEEIPIKDIKRLFDIDLIHRGLSNFTYKGEELTKEQRDQITEKILPLIEQQREKGVPEFDIIYALETAFYGSNEGVDKT